MITRNTKNKPIKTPITGVVPHPGATLPYSELRGLRISPNLVLNAIILSYKKNLIVQIYNTTHNIYYKQVFVFFFITC